MTRCIYNAKVRLPVAVESGMTRGRIVRLSEEEMRAARARMRAGVPEDGQAIDAEGIQAVDWEGLAVTPRPGKVAVSVRLDADVLAFFRADGRGYQTRINAVLRSYMVARQRAGKEPPIKP